MMGIYKRCGNTLVIPRVSPYQFRISEQAVLAAIRPITVRGFVYFWPRNKKFMEETPGPVKQYLPGV
jgi:hypothetical protein